MAEKRNLIRFILGFGLLIVAVAIRDYFPSGLGAGTWGLALYAGLLVIARPRESSPPAAGREKRNSDARMTSCCSKSRRIKPTLAWLISTNGNPVA
jgi:hypothetical protein